jgi:uncharacterized protein
MGVTRFASRDDVTGRMADFLAHLRGNGVALGVADLGLALRALGTLGGMEMPQVRAVLKAVLARKADDHGRFDELFAAFWLNAGALRMGGKSSTNARQRSQMVESQAGEGTGRADRPDGDRGAVEHGTNGRLVGARTTNLMRVDLREFVSPEDIAQAQTTAERLARAIRDRRSRRHKADTSGTRLDMRRIIRASLGSGGEPLRLSWRKRPDRPVKLVAICDVSGSMAVYARVFLAFLKGLMVADQHTDAYLFHTRLVRITDALRDHDGLRAVNRLSLLAQGFGGGTRIAGNLAAFNANYAKRLVNGRSVVMILSDGFDTDPPADLATELAQLKKRGCGIIWLNPLKGWRDYQPVAAGMAAALPYLDLFAAANTLESLAALEPAFAKL